MAYLLAIVSDILISLHFFRAGQLGPALICLLFIAILFIPFNEFKRIHQIWGGITAIIWISTLFHYLELRVSGHLPYIRLSLIFSVVIALSIASIFLINKKLKSNVISYNSVVYTFFLTFLGLTIATLRSPFPVLLGTRILGEIGLIQIFFHSLYSAFLVRLFLTTKLKSKLRSKIWTVFSLFFFAQLFLGLFGGDLFLQTGKLHYPVPAMIISGPIIRGSGYFMLILLFTTILLVGPSWCSHLCYIGAFDNLMAKKRGSVYFRFKKTRYYVLLIVVIVPFILRDFSNQTILHLVVCTFIMLSLVFFYLSYKSGRMVHCSYFCPIGVLTNYLGKINPFRLIISKECNLCRGCIKKCKYGALTVENISKRKVGVNCTLCLDCIESCNKNSLKLKFLNLSSDNSMALFYTLIISLHSIFLAVARI